MKPRIMYIELKTYPGGHDDRGPARIGRVTFNRTGKTLLYRGKRFQKGVPDSCANYHDVETGEGYWISGPKKAPGTDTSMVAAQSKLTKMFERNTGQKSGNNPIAKTKSLPDE
ncbi:MAG: hypothetical protein ABSF71_28995 [Terriglobia bacterium]